MKLLITLKNVAYCLIDLDKRKPWLGKMRQTFLLLSSLEDAQLSFFIPFQWHERRIFYDPLTRNVSIFYSLQCSSTKWGQAPIFSNTAEHFKFQRINPYHFDTCSISYEQIEILYMVKRLVAELYFSSPSAHILSS